MMEAIEEVFRMSVRRDAQRVLMLCGLGGGVKFRTAGEPGILLFLL